jgi:hypothetical protein
LLRFDYNCNSTAQYKHYQIQEAQVSNKTKNNTTYCSLQTPTTPKMTDVQATLEKAVAAINAPAGNLFDVTIICTTDDHQADYWMSKLSDGVCKKPSSSSNDKFPMVLAVSEDWNDAGGAGNGLGTLYAFSKATKLAKEKYGVDLEELLGQSKISAALYHTAGKGTRLAPLPASENNNKPGVVRIITVLVFFIFWLWPLPVLFPFHSLK